MTSSIRPSLLFLAVAVSVAVFCSRSAQAQYAWPPAGSYYPPGMPAFGQPVHPALYAGPGYLPPGMMMQPAGHTVSVGDDEFCDGKKGGGKGGGKGDCPYDQGQS
jgi:hypothetical protein